jgi:L-asparaginase
VQSISAFTSPNYPAFRDLRLHLNLRRYCFLANAGEKLLVHKKLDNNVVIVKMFSRNERNCFSSYFNIPGLKELETYGSGNAPSEGGLLLYWLKR